MGCEPRERGGAYLAPGRGKMLTCGPMSRCCAPSTSPDATGWRWRTCGRWPPLWVIPRWPPTSGAETWSSPPRKRTPASSPKPWSRRSAAASTSGPASSCYPATRAAPTRGVVLSRDQPAEVIADNPYPQAADPRCLHAVFRRQDLSQAEIAAVAAARQRARVKGSRDEVTVVRRTLFLYTPDGMGRSELATQLARSTAATGTGTAGTARNWATVTRLLALLDD